MTHTGHDPDGASRRFPAASPMVFALATGQIVSWANLFYAFTLYIAPMEAELGWSRPALNGALSVSMLVQGLSAIPVGMAIDRFGGRVIMGAGAIFGALLLAAWSLITSLPLFYVLWIGMGLAQASTLYEPAFAVLTANVRDYRRAITYLSLFGGFASTLSIPLNHVLIDHLGWRHALLVLAASQIAIPALLNMIFLRGTIGSRTRERRTGAAGQPSPLGRVLGEPAFWGVAVALCSYGLLFSGLTFHMVPLLTEAGVDLSTIVAGFAMVGPSQVLGRLILLMFGDGLSARLVGRLTFLIPPVSMCLLMFLAPAGFWGLAVFAVIYGLGNGLITIVRSAGVADILGTRGIGSILGAFATMTLAAQALSPFAIALLWQWTGSYAVPRLVFLAIALTGAGAFLVRGQRPAARPAD